MSLVRVKFGNLSILEGGQDVESYTGPICERLPCSRMLTGTLLGGGGVLRRAQSGGSVSWAMLPEGPQEKDPSVGPQQIEGEAGLGAWTLPRSGRALLPVILPLSLIMAESF